MSSLGLPSPCFYPAPLGTYAPMLFDPERDHRRSVRMPAYDYSSAGPYFITLCTYARECLFGEVIDERVELNAYGHIARGEWERSARLRPGLELDACVVMPNHLHGIVTVGESVGSVGAHSCAPLPASVPAARRA